MRIYHGWNMFGFVLILAVSCFQIVLSQNPEKVLLKKLLKNYGAPSIRPVHNSSNTVYVHFRMLIAQIIQFDERGQHLTISAWMKQLWKDEFLTWNPDEHGGVQYLTISPELIWMPDITLYENVNDKFESSKAISVIVTADGIATWFSPIILTSSCKMNTRHFPFDAQYCYMTFSSWAYDGSQLDLSYPNDTDAAQNVFSNNGVWELVSKHVHIEHLKLKCCPHPFIQLVYKLTLQRTSVFYVINIIGPCILLSVLMLLVFCLPPESGEKISLGMTNLLALMLFQQLIAENMPPLGDEVPLIGTYFFAMVFLGCFSIVCSVVVLRLYHRGGKHPVPPRLRHFLQQFRLTAHIGNSKINPRRSSTDSLDRDNTQLSNFHSVTERSNANRESSFNGNVGNTNAPSDGNISSGDEKTKDSQPLERIPLKPRSPRCYRNYPNDDDEDEEFIATQWRNLATFLDKFFFALSALTMFVMLLYALICFFIDD